MNVVYKPSLPPEPLDDFDGAAASLLRALAAEPMPPVIEELARRLQAALDQRLKSAGD